MDRIFIDDKEIKIRKKNWKFTYNSYYKYPACLQIGNEIHYYDDYLLEIDSKDNSILIKVYSRDEVFGDECKINFDRDRV